MADDILTAHFSLLLTHLVPPGDGLGGLGHLALLLEQGVLQVLGLLLGHLPEVGLGPEQLGLGLPREDVGDSSGLPRDHSRLRNLDLNILQFLTKTKKLLQILESLYTRADLFSSVWLFWRSSWTFSYTSWLSRRNLI